MVRSFGADLFNQRIINDPALHSEMEKKNWQSATDAGRSARLAGLPKTACPPFKDPDLTASWNIGWNA